jgi:CBS domain-containing protein
MQVKDIMTPNPITVNERTTIDAVAEKMKLNDIGFLPVVRGTNVIGVVTDRDIIVGATAHGWVPVHTPVCNVMTSKVITCSEEQDVRDAAQLMAEYQIRRVLVCDRRGQLCGVVSLGDIAVGVRDERLVGETLRHIAHMVAVASQSVS